MSSCWSRHPLSEVDINRLGREATDPDLSIPWIDSGDGDNDYQVTEIYSHTPLITHITHSVGPAHGS